MTVLMAAQAVASTAREADSLDNEWLFALGREPLLIVNADLDLIVDANPAAAALLNVDQGALVNTRLLDLLSPAGASVIVQALGLARAGGRVGPIATQTRNNLPLHVTLSLVRKGATAYWLVHLEPRRRENPAYVRHSTLDAIDGATEGFLVLDLDFNIELANPAFLAMADLDGPEEAVGRSVTRWLSLSVSEYAVLSAQLAQRQAVTVLMTTLQSANGRSYDVEVHAVAVPDGEHACWGFVVRLAHNSQVNSRDASAEQTTASSH